MTIRDQWALTPRREDVFSPIEQVFDKFFEDFFQSNPLQKVKANSGYPKMNITETQNEFNVLVSVPGMNNEDLNVEINNSNVLFIKGKTSSEFRHPKETEFFHLRELRQSSFERMVNLPDYVKGDPEATMKNGILKLTWAIQPKTPPPDEYRKINVKNGEVEVAPETMKQAVNLNK